MVVKLHVFNIKYSDRCSEISVVGPEALRNWIEPKYVNAYGKHYADIKDANTLANEVDIDLEFNFTPEVIIDRLDQIEFGIKQKLKEMSGLDIISFNFKILN